MIKIQNKNIVEQLFHVLVIYILVIRICLDFRYSDFGFARHCHGG